MMGAYAIILWVIKWLLRFRLLVDQPEWREEIRRVVLTDDVLRLPQSVQELVEAQTRTELAVKELSKTIYELAQAQKRTEQRVEELTNFTVNLSDSRTRLVLQWKNSKPFSFTG
jgi:hypothetical protein